MDTPSNISQAPAAAPALPPQPADLRGVPEPVQRIQAILDAEMAPQSPPLQRGPDGKFLPQNAQQQQPAQQEQPSEPQAQPGEPEAPAGPNTQVEGGEAPPEDAQAGAEIPLDQLEAIELEVVIKGEDGKDVAEKQSIKALREGYMRQADYSRKTAELARQREQVREETRKAADAEKVKYVTELQTMKDLVLQTAASELAGVNWNDLAQNNAFEYVRLDNRRKQIAQTLQDITAKQQETLTKHQSESKAATQEAAAKARAQLESDIPGWNDGLYQQLMKAGIEKYGYKQEEVAAWIDPRAFKVLHKANLYDQMQAEKKSAAPEKRVVAVPKVVRPGAAQSVNQAQRGEAVLSENLRKSGKLDDAAAVIKQRLGRI